MRALLATVVFVLFGCHRAPAPICTPGGAVVACVDAEPVTVESVKSFVREAPVPVDAPRVDPWKRAVAEAIRARLFAREARRRGLVGASDAELVQALIRAEVGDPAAARDAIPDPEARAFYDAHPDDFLKVEAVDASALVVADLALADRLAEQARSRDEARFSALVAEHSIDPSKSKQGDLGHVDEHSDLDERVLRAVLAVHRAGQISGPVADANGRFWIVRARAVSGVPRPFDALAIKNGLAKLKRDQALESLERRLRAQTKIAIDPNARATFEK